jgi:NAD-dependent aldehyde dehydrogenases
MVSNNDSPALGFSPKNLPQHLFINNEYVDAKNTETITVFSYKNNSLVSDKVPVAGAEDVDAAVAAAEAAFPAWKAISALERRNILLKFADLLDRHGVALAELTRITLGAPYGAFGAFETGMATEAFR